MRNCDICSTPIPFGTDRCPNCGYRYKPERRLSQGDRQIKKEKYMAQFQQHPSPLDGLKKSTNIDFSKVYDTLQQSIKPIRQTSIRAQRRDVAKLFKRIVTTLVIISIIIVSIAIGLGVFFGMRESYDNFYDFDIVDEYIYEWYDSYDDLQDDFYDIAREIAPYRQEIKNMLDQYDTYNYGMTESYCVDEGYLDYAYIGGFILWQETVDMNVQIYLDTDGISWVKEYSTIEYVAPFETLKVNEDIITSLSQLTGVEYETLNNYAQMFIDETHGEDFSATYFIGDAMFCLDYYKDDSISYSYIETINLD